MAQLQKDAERFGLNYKCTENPVYVYIDLFIFSHSVNRITA